MIIKKQVSYQQTKHIVRKSVPTSVVENSYKFLTLLLSQGEKHLFFQWITLTVYYETSYFTS